MVLAYGRDVKDLRTAGTDWWMTAFGHTSRWSWFGFLVVPSLPGRGRFWRQRFIPVLVWRSFITGGLGQIEFV